MGASPNVKMCTLQVNLGGCFFGFYFICPELPEWGKREFSGVRIEFVVYFHRKNEVQQMEAAVELKRSVADMYPDLLAEWSEENTLRPEEVTMTRTRIRTPTKR